MSLQPTLLKFKVDDFASLPSEPGRQALSVQTTDSGGNAWQLLLEPGGKVGGNSEVGAAGFYLVNAGATNVKVKLLFVLRDASGKAYYERYFNEAHLLKAGKNWGFPKFIKRSEILDKNNNILLDGALAVDVLVQIIPEGNYLHVPSNPFRTNLLKLLESDDDADVSFKVKGTIIYAHKLILKMNAPILYDFCTGHKKGTHIPIKDTTPSNFRIILRYLYGGDMPGPETPDADDAKELIVAADRYGIQGVKLAMETNLVHNLSLTKSNVAAWLLFADAQTCPLLKEHVISYVIARAADLMGSEWLEKLNESPKLMSELMVEMSTSLIKDSRFDSIQTNMSVNELRRSLSEKGLDVDGSKRMLVSRLEESNKRQRTE